MKIFKLIFLIILLFLLKASLLIIIQGEQQLFGLFMFISFGLLSLAVIKIKK
jgi:hypothetical protein